MSPSPVRLNHAVLFVTDVSRSLRFYQEVFGMELIGPSFGDRAAFLRLPKSANHHDLGLFAAPPLDRPSWRRAPGLYHLAWQVDTIDELAECLQVLSSAGALVGSSDHGATKSLYGADPDGNEFEILWMLPQADWGEYGTAAVVEPLNLEAEIKRWSGVHTAWT